MTTFQAIVYGVLHGFTELLPLGAGAHRAALAAALDWPAPDAALLAALFLGSSLAIFLYFIHDWASILSSLLQVVIFRRKPMTLDERMPFFLIVSSAPSAALAYYLRTAELALPEETIWITAGSLAGGALLLLAGETLSRKHKKMFDWNWLDALLVGMAQALALAPLAGPGIGRAAGAAAAGLLRNYSRESSAKFMFLAALPLLVAQAVSAWAERSPAATAASMETSWLSFAVAMAVSMAAGLLAIGSLMRHVQRGGFRGHALYRLAIGAALAVYFGLLAR